MSIAMNPPEDKYAAGLTLLQQISQERRAKKTPAMAENKITKIDAKEILPAATEKLP